jgi:hypothetical protein
VTFSTIFSPYPERGRGNRLRRCDVGAVKAGVSRAGGRGVWLWRDVDGGGHCAMVSSASASTRSGEVGDEVVDDLLG